MDDTISYRQANRDDLLRILAIYNLIIREGGFSARLEEMEMAEAEDWFQKITSPPYNCFVVLLEEQIVGFFYFSPWRPGRRAVTRTAEISYFLDDQNRGKGFGGKILEWLAAEADSFDNLLAILPASNERSAHLLEKYGYKEVGRLPAVVHLADKKIDHLILQKELR